MTIDVVKLIEILVGFFAATLTAVGVLVSYLSKSDKQSFKNLQQLYSTLEKRLEQAEKDVEDGKEENKRLDKLVSEYKKSQELMQGQMVTLKKKNDELQKENKELKIDNEELKNEIFKLSQKVKLLERAGTGQLPPRKA
jgi:chromosome segregation ATPase